MAPSQIGSSLILVWLGSQKNIFPAQKIGPSLILIWLGSQNKDTNPNHGRNPTPHRGVDEQVGTSAVAKHRGMIRRAGPLVCALALGALGGVLLGGCGGGTKTVTVSGTPAASAGAHTGSHTSSTASTPAITTTPTTTTTTGGGGTSSATGQPTGTTRTAPAPAFLHGGQSAEQAAPGEATAAAAVVHAHGYSPVALSTYHPNQTLRVLIGTREGSTAGYNQLAFFFLGNHYLGTDSSQPSAAVHIVGQSDTEVTLAYALYRPHDTQCCPSGGQAVVHFQLNNGTLTPLDPIPPTSSSAPLSRQ